MRNGGNFENGFAICDTKTKIFPYNALLSRQMRKISFTLVTFRTKV